MNASATMTLVCCFLIVSLAVVSTAFCPVPQRLIRCPFNPGRGELFHAQTNPQQSSPSEAAMKEDPRQFKFDANWHTMFEHLRQYREQTGSCLVPQKYEQDPQLGRWVMSQRKYYKLGTLSKERINKLESIGFIWAQRTQIRTRKWDAMFENLIDYKNKEGDCLVPQEYEQDPQLGRWVRNQRNRHRQGKLMKDRVEKLESIGFIWAQRTQIRTRTWDAMFEHLIDYKNKEGDCLVPHNYEQDPQLGRWVRNQRNRHRLGKLMKDRVEKLESIGFIWGCRERGGGETWDAMFEHLIDYKNKKDHCLVPHLYKQNPRLGYWVARQKMCYKRGTLSKEHISKLELIGFIWDPQERSWNEMFEHLTDYKDKEGDCEVPSLYKEDPQLGQWIKGQRRYYKNGILRKDRVEKLESIGFIWDVHECAWMEMFEQLTDHKSKTGDCLVPQKYEQNPQLGKWVMRQRKSYKLGTLSKERINKLEYIGFIWAQRPQIRTRTWGAMFEHLIDYKNEEGDCLVPQHYKQNPQLGQWVATQRRFYKLGNLSKERISKLESIGFVWKAPRGPRK